MANPPVLCYTVAEEVVRLSQGAGSAGGYDHSSWIVHNQFFSVPNMIGKLKEFAEAEGLRETERAIDYAARAHEGQVRKASAFSETPVPYIVHPLIMACHAHALGIHDDAVLAVTLLHDVCEDCGVAPEELPFSEAVRRPVALLTKDREYDAGRAAAYYEAISGDPTASIVKVIDRCNNISTMMLSMSYARASSYIDETETFVLPLIDVIKARWTQYYDAVYILKYHMLSVLESAKAAILSQ